MGFDVLGVGGATGGGSADGGPALWRISGNTSGTTASVSTGTVVLAGGNNVTLSQNANSITISAGMGTLSMYQPPRPGQMTANATVGQSTLRIYPIQLECYLVASQARVLVSVLMSTSSNSSHAGTLSIDMGMYSLTGSTLNLITSGNTNYQWTNTSDSSTASLSGLRWLSCPLNLSLTPGNYWVGFLSQSAVVNTGGASDNISFFNMTHSGAGISGPGFAATAASQGVVIGFGRLNVQTAAIPATINVNNISATGASDQSPLWMYFMNTTMA